MFQQQIVNQSASKSAPSRVTQSPAWQSQQGPKLFLRIVPGAGVHSGTMITIYTLFKGVYSLITLNNLLSLSLSFCLLVPDVILVQAHCCESSCSYILEQFTCAINNLTLMPKRLPKKNLCN